MVDLKDYIANTFRETGREKEYVISDNPQGNQAYYLTLKQNLMTGTYKIVFNLYDGDTYVGEAYEYIIIK